jgi:hypothetical protein
MRYAAAGWPVAPAAWWTGARYRCPVTPCTVTGHHLAECHRREFDPSASAVPAGTDDPARARDWWTAGSCGIGVLTGVSADAVEVDGDVGRAMAQALRRAGCPAPTAALPDGRLLIFTAARTAAAPLLRRAWGRDRSEPIWHGQGSYVPAPPTPLAGGRIRWLRAPWVDSWRLPRPDDVAAALAHAAGHETDPDTAVGGSRRRRRAGTLERSPSVSASRR